MIRYINRKRQGGWLSWRTGGGRRQISLTISADTLTSYNVFTAAGSPHGPCDVTLTINSGVIVNAGIVVGNFHAQSTLRINNNGYILGTGGSGGAGGSSTSTTIGNAGNGGNGGDAITTSIKTTIDNTSGNIWGGGGGGGGGSVHTTQNPPLDNFAGGGGGGGGGAGISSSGGNGGSTHNIGSFPAEAGNNGNGGTSGSSGSRGTGGTGGSRTGFPPTGGTGGNGGNYGSAGSAGQSGTGTYGGSVGSGGEAGFAVRLNGNSITWLGGNNGTQVKGSVA
jgi:hypothetical protein